MRETKKALAISFSRYVTETPILSPGSIPKTNLLELVDELSILVIIPFTTIGSLLIISSNNIGIEIWFGASFSVVITRSPSKSSISLGRIESNEIDSSLKILDNLKYGFPYSVAIPIFAFSILVML